VPVIRDEAGKADLGLKISGPQARSSVPFNITTTDLRDHVTYVAKETGTYVIDVTYGRLTVPGIISPDLLLLCFILLRFFALMIPKDRLFVIANPPLYLAVVFVR